MRPNHTHHHAPSLAGTCSPPPLPPPPRCALCHYYHYYHYPLMLPPHYSYKYYRIQS